MSRTQRTACVGAAVVLECQHRHDVIPFDRSSLDVTDYSAVADTIGQSRAEVIVNCTGYNAVDDADRGVEFFERQRQAGVAQFAAGEAAGHVVGEGLRGGGVVGEAELTSSVLSASTRTSSKWCGGCGGATPGSILKFPMTA